MLDTHRHVACVHINEGSSSTISWNYLHYLHCSNLGRGTERGAKMQLAAVGGHFIGNWVATTLWIMSQLCPNYVQLAAKSHPKIPQTSRESREHWKFGRNHGIMGNHSANHERLPGLSWSDSQRSRSCWPRTSKSCLGQPTFCCHAEAILLRYPLDLVGIWYGNVMKCMEVELVCDILWQCDGFRHLSIRFV